MKITSILVLIFLAFMMGSCKKDHDLKDETRDVPSVVGKTMTIEENGEEITLVFRENGEVFISGSEFGEGHEATYEQEDDEVILQLGSEEIVFIYNGKTLEFDEEE